jgi:hypothetical protein
VVAASIELSTFDSTIHTSQLTVLRDFGMPQQFAEKEMICLSWPEIRLKVNEILY